jgi:amino acid transporter
MLTTLVVGIFYVVVSYAVTIGYGVSTKNVSALASAATPFNTLADKFGDGTLSVFVNLAVISSFTALNIVTVVAVSRIFWKMGRDGLLPSAFSQLNKRQSPHVACLFSGVLALVASILFGAIWGPLNFASWLSYFATLFFIAAYLLISVGLIRFMWSKHRAEFSWAKHLVLPVISIGAMIWVLWGNIHPYPPAPLRWFIYATVGVLVISALIGQWLATTRPEAMQRAGMVLADIEAEREDALAGYGEADS